MQESFSHTTAKGTNLPVMNLKGKPYLQVMHRLVWFREEHPNWSLQTELLHYTDDKAVFRASLRDQDGKLIQTGHATELKKDFQDYLEKAETLAIGRALGMAGYGTQFCADELSEGADGKLADAPAPVPPKSAPALSAVPSAGASNSSPAPAPAATPAAKPSSFRNAKVAPPATAKSSDF